MDADQQKLLLFLRSKNLMSLASWDKHIWICSVYYVVDTSFNVYFLSEPTTQHCQNIRKNQKVACNIADSKQKVTDKKIGVQIQGISQEVTVIEKVRWMLALWNKTNPGFETIINLQNIQKKAIKSKIYQVKPEKIKFFNEVLYGPEGFKLFNFS